MNGGGRSSSVRQLPVVFCLTERDDHYDDRPYAQLWSGSAVSPAISTPDEGWRRLNGQLPVDAVTVDEWCDYPYRVVWRIDAERAIVTYCEGDVSLLIADGHRKADEHYQAILASARARYQPVAR